MKTTKYTYYKDSYPFNLDKDGCYFSDWKGLYRKASFAKRSKDLLVFIPPHELRAFDEYREADPYTVEVNIDTDFHKRRIGMHVGND